MDILGKWVATGLLTLTVLAGCAVGPDYRRPSAPVPTQFKEAVSPTTSADRGPPDREDWWAVLADPVLSDLESRVAISNQTLAAAEAGYHQARALVAEQRAALVPAITLGGAASSNGGGGPAATTHVYSLNIGATWEPDLWGRIRRTIENAKAAAEASADDLAYARLSAQTELAVDYVQLRQVDEERLILDSTVEAYSRALAIMRNRYQVGVAARSEVMSAQSQLDSSRASDVDLVKQRAQLEHAIALLIGAPPSGLTIAPESWSLHPPEIPPGLPSALLHNRPDIGAAERAAAAASALIGVQTAAYYPNITLTGQGGYAGTDLGSLLTSPSGAWSLAASAAETVFNGGARRASIRASRAAYEQAVANYRQTVLAGFAQVEDDLAAQRILAEEEARLAAARAATASVEAIARNQYLAGQADYSAVVTAQVAALSARSVDLQAQAARVVAAVDLIGALGGGWRATKQP